MGLFKILYTVSNIDWKDFFKRRENPDFKRMDEILRKCEEISETGRMGSEEWGDKEKICATYLVDEGDSLYRKMLREKGRNRCESRFPNGKDKLKDFRDKLVNYNS
jgi:hypothetical protein